MPMYDGPVVDSHHHLFWDLDNYPWMHRPMRPMIFGDDWSSLRREYQVEDLKEATERMNAHYGEQLGKIWQKMAILESRATGMLALGSSRVGRRLLKEREKKS